MANLRVIWLLILLILRLLEIYTGNRIDEEVNTAIETEFSAKTTGNFLFCDITALQN